MPYQSELSGFSRESAQLETGAEISCDLVVLAAGSETPSSPFFPEKYRRMLETEADGVQLYRHVIYPGIPRLAFAGFNHGFMHMSAVEVGTIWLCAHLRGELELPSIESMQQSIERIRRWKRAYINFEPSRSCAVNLRFQQYIDILLKELEVSPYRKLPNIFAELFCRYGPSDYRGVLDEYDRKRTNGGIPRRPIPLDT